MSGETQLPPFLALDAMRGNQKLRRELAGSGETSMLPLDAHQDIHPSAEYATPLDMRPSGASSPRAQILIRRLSCNHDLTRHGRRVLADALEAGPMLDAGAAIEITPSRLVVLTAGLVAASVTAPVGARRIFAIYVPGDILNLSGFLLRRDGYSLAATSGCEIAFLPSEKVAGLMTDFPGIQESLLRQLGLELAILRKWMEPRNPSEAIAHLYCELFTRHRLVGLARPGEPLALLFSQYQLAEAIGASLVHTNKSARILKNQGFLAFAGKLHKILDVEGLARHSGFSPDYLGVC